MTGPPPPSLSPPGPRRGLAAAVTGVTVTITVTLLLLLPLGTAAFLRLRPPVRPVCPSVCPSVCLSACPSVCLSILPPAAPFWVRPNVRPSPSSCPWVPFFYLPPLLVLLSVCPSVFFHPCPLPAPVAAARVCPSIPLHPPGAPSLSVRLSICPRHVLPSLVFVCPSDPSLSPRTPQRCQCRRRLRLVSDPPIPMSPHHVPWVPPCSPIPYVPPCPPSMSPISPPSARNPPGDARLPHPLSEPPQKLALAPNVPIPPASPHPHLCVPPEGSLPPPSVPNCRPPPSPIVSVSSHSGAAGGSGAAAGDTWGQTSRSRRG